MNKFCERYKSISKTVKAAYWYVICNILQKGLAFLTIPIYTRLLTTTEYGTYSVYNTWFSLISIFATLSLSAGFFNVGILKYENEKEKFISSIQGLTTVTSIIVLVLCGLLNEIFNKYTGLNETLLFIMSFQLLFSTPLLYWSAKERFEYKYVKVVGITISSSILTVVLSLILIYCMKDRTYSLILGSAIVQIIVGILFYIYNLCRGKVFFDKEIWSYAISFGIPLIPHYLSYSILSTSDRVMVNNICGTSDAGIYSLVCQISIVVNLVTSAIDSALNPWVYQKLKEENNESISKVTNYIMFFFGVIVIGCTLLAPEVLSIVAPKEYQVAKWAMPPVIGGCFFLYLAGCLMRIAFYYEKKHFITLASVLAAVLNIILNLIFIPIFGFMAAAYTTLISYIIFACIHYGMMKSICKKKNYKNLPFNGKWLLGISSITIICSIIILLLYEFPIYRYGIICIIICALLFNKDKIVQLYNMIVNKKNM